MAARTTYTDEQRASVARMSGYGLSLPAISDCVGIPQRSLQRHFAEELRKGRAVANGRVAQTLYGMAVSGTNTAATIFWCKTRLRWSELDRLELTGPGGGPVVTAAMPTQMLVPVLDAATWRASVAQRQAAMAREYGHA